MIWWYPEKASRKQEWILQASLLQVGEVNTQSFLVVRFRHYYGVCDPCGVQNFPDDLGLLELSDLIDDEVLPVLALAADFLLDGACAWAHS
jgi:hypothetical protein